MMGLLLLQLGCGLLDPDALVALQSAPIGAQQTPDPTGWEYLGSEKQIATPYYGVGRFGDHLFCRRELCLSRHPICYPRTGPCRVLADPPRKGGVMIRTRHAPPIRSP